MYAHVTGYYSIVLRRDRHGGGQRATCSPAPPTSCSTAGSATCSPASEPKGASVELTIDPAAQQAAWDGLGDQRGAVVALDPKTGDILAMVSKPSFDPDALATHDTAAVRRRARTRCWPRTRPAAGSTGRSPASCYPPGSMFKVVTAAAALSPDGYDAGQRCSTGPPSLDLPQTTAEPAEQRRGGRAAPNNKITPDRRAARSPATPRSAALGMELGERRAARAGRRSSASARSCAIPLRVTPSTFPAELNPPQTGAVGDRPVRRAGDAAADGDGLGRRSRTTAW